MDAHASPYRMLPLLFISLISSPGPSHGDDRASPREDVTDVTMEGVLSRGDGRIYFRTGLWEGPHATIVTKAETQAVSAFLEEHATDYDDELWPYPEQVRLQGSIERGYFKKLMRVRTAELVDPPLQGADPNWLGVFKRALSLYYMAAHILDYRPEWKNAWARNTFNAVIHLCNLIQDLSGHEGLKARAGRVKKLALRRRPENLYDPPPAYYEDDPAGLADTDRAPSLPRDSER